MRRYGATCAIDCSQSILCCEDAGESFGRFDSLSLGNESEDQVQLFLFTEVFTQVFSACDFITAITQHNPDMHFQMVRYYGWYSNKMRGQRRKRAEEAKEKAANAPPCRTELPFAVNLSGATPATPKKRSPINRTGHGQGRGPRGRRCPCNPSHARESCAVARKHAIRARGCLSIHHEIRSTRFIDAGAGPPSPLTAPSKFGGCAREYSIECGSDVRVRPAHHPDCHQRCRRSDEDQ